LLLQMTATPAPNRQCQHHLLLLLLCWLHLSPALQSCCSLLPLLLHLAQARVQVAGQQQQQQMQYRPRLPQQHQVA
jgi:hypothetical protein